MAPLEGTNPLRSIQPLPDLIMLASKLTMLYLCIDAQASIINACWQAKCPKMLDDLCCPMQAEVSAIAANTLSLKASLCNDPGRIPTGAARHTG